MKVLAIDIGGTKVATAIMDRDLNLSDRKQIASVNNNTPETFSKFIKTILDQYDPESYDGIAIGTTGTVHEGRINCLTPTSIGALMDFPFIDTFREFIKDKPITAINDAQAATLAEYSRAKIPNMCFITISTGVGGGFIINDRLYRGHTSLAGHIGHTLIRMPSPVKQIYGDYAIVEDIASGTAIAKATKDWDTPCDTATVFKLAVAGDQKAITVVDNAAQAIATLIAGLVVSNDIHDYFLGGSVALNTHLPQLIESKLKEMPKQYHARLHMAHFTQDAVLVGAAQYFYQNY